MADLEPAIEQVPVDRLVIYHVTEAELDALERGSPDSLLLNITVFFSSMAVSFLATLLTTTIPDVRIYTVFVVVTVVSIVTAAVCSLLWNRSRKSVATVASTIRNRRPPRGEQIA